VLQPTQIPEGPWQQISVDFITDLPRSGGFDAILCVIDYFTKQAHFIPTEKTCTAEQLSQIYLTEVWKHHGTPRKIISDRGPQFAAQFTKAFQEGLGIKTTLSTAYHPETDGQTERLNQFVEAFLRMYLHYHQDDWIHYLPMAEFAYNNQEHSATNRSPFQALYGYDPSFDISVNPINRIPKATERLELLKQQNEEIQAALKLSKERMKEQERGKRTDKQLQVGDKVWLELTNLKTTQPSAKLGPRRIGPFPIEKCIGELAYKVKLPHSMKMIHPVFHIGLLRPYKEDLIANRHPPPPPPIDVEESRYEVEEILDSRRKGRGIQYLVKWKGYPDSENSWEPKRNVDDAEDALKQFHKKFPGKPKPEDSALRTIHLRRGVMSQLDFDIKFTQLKREWPRLNSHNLKSHRKRK
jgi:hypothetical protein